MGITYGGEHADSGLQGFVDSDFARDTDDRKSTIEYVFLHAGGAVCWGSKKQATFFNSTTEAEFIAAAMGVREALWYQKLGRDLEGWGVKGREGGWLSGISAGPVQIYSDSMSALSLLTRSVPPPPATQERGLRPAVGVTPP
jgi:hypothetical protein